MGKAEEWQNEFTSRLKISWDTTHDSGFPVTIFNPRREDWDSTWEQSTTNNNFVDQVEWELHHLDEADIKVFYFDPATKSPVYVDGTGPYASIAPKRLYCLLPSKFLAKR